MLPSSELSSESYKLANVLELCAADSVAQLCHQYRYIEAQQGSFLRISYLRQASLADRFMKLHCSAAALCRWQPAAAQARVLTCLLCL